MAAPKSRGDIALELVIVVLYLSALPVVVWWIASFRTEYALVYGALAAILSIGIAPLQVRGILGNEDMTGQAKRLGLRYVGDSGAVGRFGLTRFPFIDHPDFPVKHFAEGTWRGVAVGQFLSGFTPGRDTGNYWIEVAQLPRSLPPIEIVPRRYWGRREDVGDDVFVESSDFTERWRVMCPDVRYAHAVVHPRMMERLLALGDDGFPVTIDGGKVFSWARQEAVKADDIAARLNLLCEVMELIPRHVWLEYGRPLGSVASGGAAPSPGAAMSAPLAQQGFLVPVRDKNLWGRVSLLLSLTWILAPLGILVGYSARRNVSKGLATNIKTARAGIVLGYVLTALLVLAMAAAIGNP